MDVYKENIQSYGSIDKLKLRIVVRGYLQNKETIGVTWDPTASMSNMKYLLSGSAKQKAIVNQLDFIGAFIQANIKYLVL